MAKQKTYNPKVIVVFFNPTTKQIATTNATSKVVSTIVVDNSTLALPCDAIDKNITYLPLHKNNGIAYAQNIGIKEALKDKECTHIVFLDQDSQIHKEYVNSIVNEYERINKKDKNLFMLGPTVVNSSTNETYHSAVHKYETDLNGFSIRREIISSGSCVSTERIRQIGQMDEKLFIDFVDFDLCWRANAQGLVNGITTNISISHLVGDRELSFPFGYKVIVSSPQRYFYQYRNHLLLTGRKYVPLQWKVATAIKHLARLVYFPLFVENGGKCWKQMIRGLSAGFRNYF